MVSVIVLKLKGTAGCPICPPVTILSAEMKIYKFGSFLGCYLQNGLVFFVSFFLNWQKYLKLLFPVATVLISTF